MSQLIHVRHNCNEFVLVYYLHINFNSFDAFIIERLSDTWVTVSDEEDASLNDDIICNEIINGKQTVVTVTCGYKNRNPPLRGRYVMIKRKDNAYQQYLLNFCEVEVLSCHPGFWGKDLANGDCSQSCGRCIEGSCRVLDGYCYTGCQEGYWGDSCNSQCNCKACDRLTGCRTVGEF